jgi:hypothetical protein
LSIEFLGLTITKTKINHSIFLLPLLAVGIGLRELVLIFANQCKAPFIPNP